MDPNGTRGRGLVQNDTRGRGLDPNGTQGRVLHQNENSRVGSGPIMRTEGGLRTQMGHEGGSGLKCDPRGSGPKMRPKEGLDPKMRFEGSGPKCDPRASCGPKSRPKVRPEGVWTRNATRGKGSALKCNPRIF